MFSEAYYTIVELQDHYMKLKNYSNTLLIRGSGGLSTEQVS